MYLSIIFLALISWFCSGLFGRFIGRQGSGFISTFLIGCSFLMSLLSFYEVGINGSLINIQVLEWFSVGSLYFSWGFLFDTITVTMLIVVTSISFLVHLYSISYMSADPHIIRFMSYLSLFTFFMLCLVTSNNFVQLFLGWEGVGLSSYLLINFWFTRIQANKSALKAIIVNRFGDFGLVLGLLGIINIFHSVNFGSIFCLVEGLSNKYFSIIWWDIHSLSFISFFIFLGCVGKSAQLGLHTWLPDAMEGPTPVSALIHAATMVTAGVFLLVRSSPLVEFSSDILYIITIFGAITAFFAGTVGIFQNDLKRVIAYSTCSQLGYMIFVCGLSNYSVAMFHLMNHAFFKALLFLSAGSVIHSIFDDQDMRKMGGLIKLLPLTYSCFIIGSLALMGFPFTTGFYSKDVILEIALANNFSLEGLLSYHLGLLGACCTAFYSARLLYMTFFGEIKNNKKTIGYIHDSPFQMSFPMIFLGIMSIFIGFIFKDLFIGVGTDFWKNSIGLQTRSVSLLQAEFLQPFLKLIPVFLSILFGLLSLYFYEYKYNYIYIGRHSRPGVEFRLESYARVRPFNRLWRELRTGLGRYYYIFFNRKWHIDTIYNYYLVGPVLRFSYITSYKLFDRGLIELFGPSGLVRVFSKISFVIKSVGGGYLFNYVFIMLISFCFLYCLVILKGYFIIIGGFVVFFFIYFSFFTLENFRKFAYDSFRYCTLYREQWYVDLLEPADDVVIEKNQKRYYKRASFLFYLLVKVFNTLFCLTRLTCLISFVLHNGHHYFMIIRRIIRRPFTKVRWLRAKKKLYKVLDRGAIKKNNQKHSLTMNRIYRINLQIKELRLDQKKKKTQVSRRKSKHYTIDQFYYKEPVDNDFYDKSEEEDATTEPDYEEGYLELREKDSKRPFASRFVHGPLFEDEEILVEKRWPSSRLVPLIKTKPFDPTDGPEDHNFAWHFFWGEPNYLPKHCFNLPYLTKNVFDLTTYTLPELVWFEIERFLYCLSVKFEAFWVRSKSFFLTVFLVKLGFWCTLILKKTKIYRRYLKRCVKVYLKLIFKYLKKKIFFIFFKDHPKVIQTKFLATYPLLSKFGLAFLKYWGLIKPSLQRKAKILYMFRLVHNPFLPVKHFLEFFSKPTNVINFRHSHTAHAIEFLAFLIAFLVVMLRIYLSLTTVGLTEQPPSSVNFILFDNIHKSNLRNFYSIINDNEVAYVRNYFVKGWWHDIYHRVFYNRNWYNLITYWRSIFKYYGRAYSEATNEPFLIELLQARVRYIGSRFVFYYDRPNQICEWYYNRVRDTIEVKAPLEIKVPVLNMLDKVATLINKCRLLDRCFYFLLNLFYEKLLDTTLFDYPYYIITELFGCLKYIFKAYMLVESILLYIIYLFKIFIHLVYSGWGALPVVLYSSVGLLRLLITVPFSIFTIIGKSVIFFVLVLKSLNKASASFMLRLADVQFGKAVMRFNMRHLERLIHAAPEIWMTVKVDVVMMYEDAITRFPHVYRGVTSKVIFRGVFVLFLVYLQYKGGILCMGKKYSAELITCYTDSMFAQGVRQPSTSKAAFWYDDQKGSVKKLVRPALQDKRRVYKKKRILFGKYYADMTALFWRIKKNKRKMKFLKSYWKQIWGAKSLPKSRWYDRVQFRNDWIHSCLRPGIWAFILIRLSLFNEVMRTVYERYKLAWLFFFFFFWCYNEYSLFGTSCEYVFHSMFSEFFNSSVDKVLINFWPEPTTLWSFLKNKNFFDVYKGSLFIDASLSDVSPLSDIEARDQVLAMFGIDPEILVSEDLNDPNLWPEGWHKIRVLSANLNTKRFKELGSFMGDIAHLGKNNHRLFLEYSLLKGRTCLNYAYLDYFLIDSVKDWFFSSSFYNKFIKFYYVTFALEIINERFDLANNTNSFLDRMFSLSFNLYLKYYVSLVLTLFLVWFYYILFYVGHLPPLFLFKYIKERMKIKKLAKARKVLIKKDKLVDNTKNKTKK